MATTDTTNGTVSAEMRWVLRSLRAVETIEGTGVVKLDQEFSAGTDAGEWNTVYVDKVTIAGSGALSLPLDQLLVNKATYYDVLWGIEFTAIRGLMIRNLETVPGRDLRISSTGADNWAQIFNGSTTSEIMIPAGGALVWIAPSITTFGATATDLKLNVPGSDDVTFELYLGGI